MMLFEMASAHRTTCRPRAVTDQAQPCHWRQGNPWSSILAVNTLVGWYACWQASIANEDERDVGVRWNARPTDEVPTLIMSLTSALPFDVYRPASKFEQRP